MKDVITNTNQISVVLLGKNVVSIDYIGNVFVVICFSEPTQQIFQLENNNKYLFSKDLTYITPDTLILFIFMLLVIHNN